MLDKQPVSEPENFDFNSQSTQTPEPHPAENLPPPNVPPPPPPKSPKRAKKGGCLVAFLIAALLLGGGLAVLAVSGLLITSLTRFGESPGRGRVREIVIQSLPGADDKIVIIDIKGMISNGIGHRGADPRLLSEQFRRAIEDPDVRAVVLHLDTPGGEVTASDEIHRGVKRVSQAGKPVVGSMSSVCASGGYYVAAACDYLMANKVTLTGSIGVMFPHIDYRELLDKIGIRQNTYTSGQMKDMLSGGVERTETEKRQIDSHMQRIVNQSFDRFLAVVAHGREQYQSVEDLRQQPFSDGRIMLGEDALQYNLIDELGYFDEAVEKARELSGAYNSNVIRYQETPSLWQLLMANSGRQKIKIEGLPAATLPDLNPHNIYYLMPPLGQ